MICWSHAGGCGKELYSGDDTRPVNGGRMHVECMREAAGAWGVLGRHLGSVAWAAEFVAKEQARAGTPPRLDADRIYAILDQLEVPYKRPLLPPAEEPRVSADSQLPPGDRLGRDA